MPDLLYIDSSAFLRRVLRADDFKVINSAVAGHERMGGTLVSSRLLWLETRRVQVRENLESELLDENLRGVSRLPLTEAVWSAAYQIDVHVKTLDSLHLATCRMVGADLLTRDVNMAAAARHLGIAVLPG